MKLPQLPNLKLIMMIGVIWLWHLNIHLHAAEATFSPSTIIEGQSSTLTITAPGRISEVQLPTIDGLTFAQNSNSSSYSMSSRSGSGSQVSHTVTYQVAAQKFGTYKIPPFSFKVDGKPYQVSGLQLTVNQAKTLTPAEITRTQPDFFIERQLSSQVAYVNEPIFETIQLYLKKPWQDLKRISSDNSWLKVITVDKTNSSQVEKYGLPYTLVEIHRILIPLKNSEIELGRYGIEISYIDDSPNSQNYFSHFFRTVKTSKVFAPSQLININELPQSQKPADFSGFVGQAQLLAELSKTTLEVGESLVLQLTFTAQGWLDSLQTSPPQLGSNFQIYDDKPELDERIAPQLLAGTKTFRFFMIPLQAGTFDLGRYSWSYFDPQTSSYQTLTTELGTITVSPSSTSSSTHNSNSNSNTSTATTQPILTTTPPTQVIQLNTDIADIHRTWPPPQRFLSSTLSWLIISSWLIITILLIILIYRWWQRRITTESSSAWQKQLLAACDNQHMADFFDALVGYTAHQSTAQRAAITAYDIKHTTAIHFKNHHEHQIFATIIDTLETALALAGSTVPAAGSPPAQPPVLTTSQWQQLNSWIKQW